MQKRRIVTNFPFLVTSPSWSLCLFLIFFYSLKISSFLLPFHITCLIQFSLRGKFSLWRKFKSHKILSLLCCCCLSAMLCALWILKHKYAPCYTREHLIKCTRLSAQLFSFIFELSFCMISFCGSFIFAFDVWVREKNFIWLPQIAIFYVFIHFSFSLLLLPLLFGLCYGLIVMFRFCCCWAHKFFTTSFFWCSYWTTRKNRKQKKC